MTPKIRIAEHLELPLDVVTQAIAILARKGAGKTYTASVIVEEVIRAKVPVVVLDPTGAWWGLRSSEDGERPGLPVVIFGGDHADVPLERMAGTEVANVVLEHPGAYIVDLSGFESKAAEQRFAADFLERLYRGKRPDTGPVLLVVDEADVFAPQQPRDRGDQLRTLGALEAIVRRGRIKGLGGLLITQRAAVLNKNVLEQTEILVAMQTTGPRDRAAIDAWIEANSTREQRDTVMGSLASLSLGEAWVWSPSFLGILQRVRIRRRTTFDSSRTPAAGEAVVGPRAFAPVDLEQLGARILATREQAKDNDPAELRRRIAELERAASTSQPEVRVERVEVPILTDGDRALIEACEQGMRAAAAKAYEVADLVLAALGRVSSTPMVGAEAPRGVRAGRMAPEGSPVPHQPAATPPVVAPASASPVQAGPASLGKAERSILGALASYPMPLSRDQLAFLAEYHPRSSGFTNAVGALRTAGLITPGYPTSLTPEGSAAVPPASAELINVVEYWVNRFGKAERTILELLIAAHPQPVDREELAAKAGYHPRSSGFTNALGKLRGLGLVDGFGLSAGFAALLAVRR